MFESGLRFCPLAVFSHFYAAILIVDISTYAFCMRLQSRLLLYTHRILSGRSGTRTRCVFYRIFFCTTIYLNQIVFVHMCLCATVHQTLFFVYFYISLSHAVSRMQPCALEAEPEKTVSCCDKSRAMTSSCKKQKKYSSACL